MPPPVIRAELQALQAALAAEHAAVYGYGVAGAMLTGAEQARAMTDWKAHQEARDTLQAMITKLGAGQHGARDAIAVHGRVLGRERGLQRLDFGLGRRHLRHRLLLLHQPCHISRAAGCRVR